MKKVIMHKYHNPDKLFGCYGWSIEEVWNDWDHIYSDPYYVEIPDDFDLGKTKFGEVMYFKKGCDVGYELSIGNSKHENSSPYLIGGKPVESIKLNVIGPVDKE